MAECKHLIDPASACGTCNPPAMPPPDSSLWGPFFSAAWPGECDGCGDDICPGDSIRADGEGGWLCKACGDDSRWSGRSFTAGTVIYDEVMIPAPAELRRRFEEGYS